MPIKKIHYQEIDSTQDEAKRLIKDDNQNLTSEDCLVVSADMQSKGRGRFGRTWISPLDSGLYFSLVTLLDAQIFNQEQSEIEFAERYTKDAALITIDALKKFFAANLEKLQIKPINDIYYADKKLAGILVEIINHNNQKFLIVGIGINLKPITQNFENTLDGKNAEAISLEEILAEKNSDQALNKDSLLDCISQEFLKKYSRLNQQ